MSKPAIVIYQDATGQYVYTQCYFEDDVAVPGFNNAPQECTLTSPKQTTGVIEIPTNVAAEMIGWSIIFVCAIVIFLSTYGLVRSNYKRIQEKKN